MYLKNIWILLLSLMAFVGCGDDSNKSAFEEIILPTLKQNMDYEQLSKYYKDLCDKGEVRACALLRANPTIDSYKQYLQNLQEAFDRYQHIASLYEKPCLDTESSESKQACEAMAYASYSLWYSTYFPSNLYKFDLQDVLQSLNISLPRSQDLRDYVRKACTYGFLEPCLYNVVMVVTMSHKTSFDEEDFFVTRDRFLQLAQTRLKADSSDIIALVNLMEIHQLLWPYYSDIALGYIPSATLDKQEANRLYQESKTMVVQYAQQLCKTGVNLGCEIYQIYKSHD
ncbi:hypothetical protein [uncultured Helicobacter sp.]|uniref:hypothetical protein n=1 Tax=uncultured Helicobacter sp. TaxID=175537 RepID=UPI00374E4B47